MHSDDHELAFYYRGSTEFSGGLTDNQCCSLGLKTPSSILTKEVSKYSHGTHATNIPGRMLQKLVTLVSSRLEPWVA